MAIAAADPTASVPSCPDWSANDLCRHLAEVQRFWATIVSNRVSDRAQIELPAPLDDALADFDDAHRSLVEALDGTDDDVAVWTWAADAQHVGFVRRRQAHEALIHRVDAELAAGARSPVDAELAADGVDEALSLMLGGIPTWATSSSFAATGRISATDVGRTWHIRTGVWSGRSPTTGTEYVDEPGMELVDDPLDSVDFEVSAGAGDLDLWLWGRPPEHPIEPSGDPSTLTALVGAGID